MRTQAKEIWRFYTVPGDPSKPFENKQMEIAAKTWGDEYWTDLPGGGSGSVWSGMIYDSKTDLLIFGAGNPGTDGYEEKYVDKKMLFTGSIIAVNASTGEYVLASSVDDRRHISPGRCRSAPAARRPEDQGAQSACPLAGGEERLISM